MNCRQGSLTRLTSILSTRISSSRYGISVDSPAYGTLVSTLPTLFLMSRRPYWRCYFPNTAAIIYVIDSADTARLKTSRSELLTMLSEEELAGVPLLVFCNKQDMEGALKPEQISEELGLAGGEKERQWSVRGSSALKGEGLEEGLDWCVKYAPRHVRIFIFMVPRIQASQRDTEKVDGLRIASLRSHLRSRVTGPRLVVAFAWTLSIAQPYPFV